MIGLLFLLVRLPFIVLGWMFRPFWRPTGEHELRRIRKALERRS